jgi:hypothetical protein
LAIVPVAGAVIVGAAFWSVSTQAKSSACCSAAASVVTLSSNAAACAAGSRTLTASDRSVGGISRVRDFEGGYVLDIFGLIAPA